MDLELRSVGFVGAGLGAVISVVCSWESNNSSNSRNSRPWSMSESVSQFHTFQFYHIY